MTVGQPMADDKDLSGLDWFKRNHAKYPNSAKIADLDSGFKSNVKAFTDALKAAGAKVTVSATLRNPKRAALMHWAFKVAKGNVKAAAVPKIAGVRITWDHGDDSKSVAAAAEMVGKSGFNIAFQPSLTSRHIQGKAIDMTITWSKSLTIKNRKGEDVTIDSAPTNGRNKELHKVGATYGVVKLVSDPPHWSTDGR
jgi:hypothetical protein